MKKRLLACLFLAAAMVPQLKAEVTYTCTAGKNFGANEGVDKMFDNNTDTKYCGGVGEDLWALVTASEPVYVRAYETTTANDNKEYGGRCARWWTLYGTNDEAVAADANSEGWVTLSDLDNEPWPADLIPKENFYTQRFYCDKNTVGTAYKYFKFHIQHGDNTVQLSEVKILGETTPIVTYDWVEELSAPGSDKAVDWSLKAKWEGSSALAGKSLVIKTSDDKAHSVIKYSLTTHDDNVSPNRAPKTWIVEGSEDLTQWVTIDEVTEGDPITNERVKTFDFTPSNTKVACKYIRLTLTSMKGNGYQQLGEFHVVAASEEHVHNWVLTDGKEPTCVEDGGGVYTCSDCGAKKLDASQPATGEHNYIESDEHDHKNCNVCGRPDPEYMTAVDGFYQPTTADHFVWLAEMIQFNETVNIRLIQDVDLTGFNGFGNGSDIVPFKGEFDGAGHWLKNLTIDVTERNAGLFGSVEGANIHDLGFENAYVKSSQPNVGILAGNANNTTITRVAVMGNSEAHGYDHVGAIAGNTEGSTTVSNCLSDITVHSTTYQAGGLIGTTNGLTLENCLFTGQVLNDGNNAGGLIALLDSEKSPTIIRNNISAASLLKANNDGQKPIMNTANRTATYENNRVAASQLYQKGSEEPVKKEWTNADDESGLTTADRDMKCLSFYINEMGWDMEKDWKFIEAGMYPVLAWMDGEAGSQTVSVPETRYATAVAEAELNIPEGVEVYAVKVAADENTPAVATAAENADAVQAADKDLTLVKLTGVIPANTPVLVKADKGDYTFSHHVEYGDEVGENHLTAAAEDATADGTHYTLATDGKKVGFARVNSGETVPAGSVYLSVPASSTKDFYTIYDSTITGVESVAVPTDEEAETIYNIAGQRLNRMQNGINIVNGKKILK